MAGPHQGHKKGRGASNKSTSRSNNTVDTSTPQATSKSIDTSLLLQDHGVAYQEPSYDMTGQGFISQAPTSTSSDTGSVEECPTVADSEKTIEYVTVDTEQTRMPFIPDATSPAVFASFYNMTRPHTTQGPHATEDFGVSAHDSHLYPKLSPAHPLISNNVNNTSPASIPYDDGPPSASMPSYSSTNADPTVNNHHLDLNQDLPADHPHATSTQFNNWLYQTSNNSLPFSEWALKKNNWECRRYERL